MDNKTDQVTVLDSWSSISEKTVFVLDRSPYFTHVSSGHAIDGDYMNNLKRSGVDQDDSTHIQPFDRSLWTCAVEAVVGYSRLVWDLFTPDQKSISIIAVGANDESAPGRAAEPTYLEKITTWKDEDQNLDALLKSLAKRSHTHQIRPPSRLKTIDDIASYPNCGPDSDPVLSALEQALNDLVHLTAAQQEKRSALKNQRSKHQAIPSKTTTDNNGRIILISSFRNDNSVHEMVHKFQARLKAINESVISKNEIVEPPSLSSLNYCDLVIINTFPLEDIGPCSKIQNTSSFRPSLHVKTYSVRSGRIISGLLNNLCLQHHNLKSTTITGIPMKEEQSASSSSQYDVEILHCSSIHEDILKSDSPLLDGVVETIDRNSFPCETFKLQWLTPRVSNVDLYHCLAASRITAVDVNSRPSSCLTNFLLSGRQVLLEIFKSKGNRMTTHVLASHNGELYIHSLATAQNKVNFSDLTPISDNLGGKVGDYRMNDFTNFMKRHILCKPAIGLDDPLNRSLKMIQRQTIYWPLVLGHTILLNIPHMAGPLLTNIPKESMSHANVEDCKRTIDDLIKSEKEGQAIPSLTLVDIIKPSSSQSRSNSDVSRLNQLYKLFWNELEYFLRVHSTTPEHEAVLDHLIERRLSDKNHQKGTKRAASKSTLMVASSSAKKSRTSEAQLIPELSELSNAASSQTAIFYKSGLSLYQTYSHLYRLHYQSRCKLPFVGRRDKQAILYQHLNRPMDEQPIS